MRKIINYKIINPRKRTLIRMADSVLSPVMAPFSVHRAANSLREDAGIIRKILVVRLAYIGDVIMTLPAIEHLHNAFPEAQIHFLTSHMASPILENIPGLARIIPYNAPWFYSRESYRTVFYLKKTISHEHYDLGIDFRGDLRNIFFCLYLPGIPRRLSYVSGGGGVFLTHPVDWSVLKHKVEYHLDLLRFAGIPAQTTPPVIKLLPSEAEKAAEMLLRLLRTDDPPVLIHTGARLPLKCWPLDSFASLVKNLHHMGIGPLVTIGGSGEKEKSRILRDTGCIAADLTDRLTIRELAAALACSRLLICHDSAPMHIAAAVGTKIVALFGPSRPVETSPFGAGHRVVEAPCMLKDHCDESRCLRSDGNHCMADIKVEEVLKAVLDQLSY